MKSSSINKVPKATNIKDLHCYSGMVNYLIKYSARLAKLGDSLRELTKKNVPSIRDLNILNHLKLSKKKLPV